MQTHRQVNLGSIGSKYILHSHKVSFLKIGYLVQVKNDIEGIISLRGGLFLRS